MFYKKTSKKQKKNKKRYPKISTKGINLEKSTGDPYGIRTHTCMRERHVC